MPSRCRRLDFPRGCAPRKLQLAQSALDLLIRSLGGVEEERGGAVVSLPQSLISQRRAGR